MSENIIQRTRDAIEADFAAVENFANGFLQSRPGYLDILANLSREWIAAPPKTVGGAVEDVAKAVVTGEATH